MHTKKVLILTNPLNHEGGVVNYYNLFFQAFDSNVIELKHLPIGSRSYLFYYPKIKRIVYPFYLIFDLIRFSLVLIFDRNIKIVQVNPSFIPIPLIRDGLFVLLSKVFRRKVIIFYRGWKLPTVNKIRNNLYLRWIFNKIFQYRTMQIVLASSFKNDLLNLSPDIAKKIMVTTTVINAKDIVVRKESRVEGKKRVLYLGRVEDKKGIDELVDAIISLHNSGCLNRFSFTIAGHEAISGYIASLQNKIKNSGINEGEIKFLGRITGREKFQLYAHNDIYILPSYTEGCPNSVLEALSSGLYCITTRVGALPDLIVPGVNGVFVNSQNSMDIHNALLSCYQNEEYNCFYKDNAKKAIEKFDVHGITSHFEKLYIEYADE